MRRYADQYQHNQVMTANPGELLLLTYQGLLRFLREGAAAMQRQDLYAQSEALTKAQQILLYLTSTLNPEADPQLCAELQRIYAYLIDRLTAANMRDDAAALEEVSIHVAQLYSAWEEAEAISRGAVVGGGVPVPAGAR